MTIETTPDYWDCECEHNYIHAKADTLECPACLSIEAEQPDSRVSEISTVRKRQPRCPEDNGPGGLFLAGCGSSDLSGPDDEGLYDCKDCGLFFSADAANK